MSYLFDIILFSVFLFWIFLFIKNIIFFNNKKLIDIDSLFSSREKSFESILFKIELLEKLKNRDLSFYKKQALFYQKNAKRTRRGYHHFSHLLEPAILNLYLSDFVDLSKSKKTKMLYKNLDVPYQHFFTFLSYSVFISFFAIIIMAFFYGSGVLGVILILLFPLTFIIALFIIYLNFLILDGIIQLFLYFKKEDNGAANRNFLIMSRMFVGYSSKGNANVGYVIGGVGVGMMDIAGGSDFGGFGGGDFGGGGAGGSW